MEDLFYDNPDQVKKIVEEFGDAILPMKKADQPFFSKYRVFNYKEELENAEPFGYSAQNPTDFIANFASYFEDAVNWDSTGVLYNVHPNVNVYGQVASFLASFANPNFAQDISSGKLMLIEKQLIEYFASLAGWDTAQAGGIFTFGGKGTNLYGLKIALDKTFPNIREQGLQGKIKVISNDLGHPCHVEVCNWVGIGTENCIRLKTEDTTVPVELFRETFEEIVKNGEKLPLIILNGLSTLNHAVDDIKGIAEARDEIVAKYKLDYVPHIHIDSVLGWVYLLLARYDFDSNPLNIKLDVLAVMKKKYLLMANVAYADSFGSDFHKTGFCGYSSSLFMVKDKKPLQNIERSYHEDDSLEFSKYSPYSYSLELSRPPHGPISAYATLKTMGVEGFTQVLAALTESFRYMKDTFHAQDHTEVLNYDEDSNLLFFVFKPRKDIVFTENMESELVEEIKAFNTGFYQFLIHKLERGEANIFFSCSRSHKYLGQSFGSIKVYSWNARFNVEEAKKVTGHINELFQEYIKGFEATKDYNIFDFLDVKGANK